MVHSASTFPRWCRWHSSHVTVTWDVASRKGGYIRKILHIWGLLEEQSATLYGGMGGLFKYVGEQKRKRKFGQFLKYTPGMQNLPHVPPLTWDAPLQAPHPT